VNQDWWEELHNPDAPTIEMRKPRRLPWVIPWTITILTFVGAIAFVADVATPMPNPMTLHQGN
jgi:hypothetical protein